MPSIILNLKNDRKQSKNELYRYLLNNSFYSVKEFLEFIRDNYLINYFCCNLYCFIMLCTVFDFGDCSIDICLFVLYYVVCVTCFFLISFMSDSYMTEFVDLRSDMYVCVCIVNYECQLHQKPSLCFGDWSDWDCFGELIPCNTFLVFLEIKTDYGKGQACLALSISWYASDYQRAETWCQTTF